MNLEFKDEKRHEREGRMYLESLIAELNEDDPKKAKAAEEELRSTLSSLRVLSIELSNSIETTRVAFGKDDEDLKMKRRQLEIWHNQIKMIKDALTLANLQ